MKLELRKGETLAQLLKRARKPSKYKNTRCEYMGEKFDSKKELNRHLVLLDMQKRGEIKNLKRQPRYKLKVGPVLVCTYVPDWSYLIPGGALHITGGGRVVPCGKEVCEDAKGFQTREFKLKWKLAQALYPEIDWRLS